MDENKINSIGAEMISFQNVTKEFQLDAQNSIKPLSNINLEIAAGEFIIIIGRSGSGKTTLLNLASGMIKPSEGSIRINDRDLKGMPDKQLSTLRGEMLGFVFQFPSLLPALTVKENVVLPAIFGIRDAKKNAEFRAVELLRTVGLVSKLNVYPKQLSAGEQKRVVIARSLINRPKIILADEPTSDLDEQTELEIMDLLRVINKTGVTCLMVTHSLQLVSYSTRAFSMQNGGLTEIHNDRR
jgi:ABC-type lipoprotein export system ATPase subunit